MKYKIIQIIPNNKELYAEYEGEENFTLPIVCFALVEYENGEREVIPFDINGDGSIGELAGNFSTIVYKPII